MTLILPFYQIPSFHIAGPFSLQPFGLLVVTGIYLGLRWIVRRAKQMGLSQVHAENGMQWGVIPGLMGAHVGEIVFYQWDRLMVEGPLLLLKFWDGISSYGGFIAGVLGYLYYHRKHTPKQMLEYADIMLQGLVVGWIFGRLGCTVVFDHPGPITDFFLAQPYPFGTGETRHNLGFYEFLYTVIVMFPATLLIHHLWKLRRVPAGLQAAMICLTYAPFRFALDFMRSTDLSGSDVRYFGLTFAHYSSIATLIIGVLLVLGSYKKKSYAPKKG